MARKRKRTNASDKEDEKPVVELTDEEKDFTFRPLSQSDLTSEAVNRAFGDFTCPEKTEGFDDIRYAWNDEAASKKYLKKWVVEKKLTARMEDLQPSKWFAAKYEEWQTTVKAWEAKQKAFNAKQPPKKKTDDDEDEPEEVDCMGIQDVSDIGNGEPLCAKFQFEDWALFTIRYELYLLQQAFANDVNDPDRIGIHETNIEFYYNKYFKKFFNIKNFGQNNITGLTEMIKDTVSIEPTNKTLCPNPSLAKNLETPDLFLKVTEDQRRARQRRIDAGDETARLKIVAPGKGSGKRG